MNESEEFDHKIMITLVREGNNPLRIGCGEGELLLDALARHGIGINASCGKRGTCGKCKIKLLKGNLEITPFDEYNFTKEHLLLGYRLACKAHPKEEIVIRLGEEEEGFEVVTERVSDRISKEEKAQRISEERNTTSTGASGYGIAIDLGTTTLALAFIDLATGRVVDTYTGVNHQRSFGADVISRMKQSNEGKLQELQELIRHDLLVGIRQLLLQNDVENHKLNKVAIAGNTTMGHLLLGYSCKTLGTFPFTPVDIREMHLEFPNVFHTEEYQAEVVILPGISVFVGGDITAGLLVCDFDREKRVNLLVDLGTNGEMAIGNQDKILVTSTAAGPAFEGGNISCGVGGIPGAISEVEIEEGEITIKTIHNVPPVGICGTGIVELTSELLKERIIDDTGLLRSDYFERGYQIGSNKEFPITYTQKDIREFQMAKAAIRAGVEVLIKEYGSSYLDIDKVYIAGGFGYKLNMEKALHIGLLPRELEGKIITIGNSSLEGAIRYLIDSIASDRAQSILQAANEIHLAKNEEFNDLYISYMGFEQDEERI